MSPTEFQDQLQVKLSEKWASFADLDAPPETSEVPQFAEADLQALLESERELAAASVTMQEFLIHPGWKLMENYRQARINALRSKLESLDPVLDAQKILRAQCELSILRGYENFVLSRVGNF